MNEFGQKVYKWVVWIAIIAFVLVGIIKKIDSIANPLVTEEELINELAERSNSEALMAMAGSDEAATGEYVALAAMKAIGGTSVSLCFGQKYENDDDLIQAAVDCGIISKKDLKKKVKADKAKEILGNVEEYFSDFDNYPVFCNVDYNVDIQDTENWDIETIKPDENIAVVSATMEAPKEGQYIILKDDYGIGYFRKIAEVKENGSSYELVLEEWNEPELPVNSYEFAGPVDFSYLTDDSPVDEDEIESDDGGIEETTKNSFPFSPLKSYALFSNRKEGEYKASLEIGGEITIEKEDDNYTFTPTIYGQFSTDKKPILYTVKKDKNGTLKIKKAKDEETKEAREKAAKATVDVLPGKVEEGIEASISFKAYIDELQIYTCCLKKQKEGTVRLNAAKVGLETSFAGKYSGEIPIFEFRAPVAGFDMASVTVGIYLTIGAEGEISLTYGIVDAEIDFEFSNGKGSHHEPKTIVPSFNVNGEISLEGGLVAKAGLHCLFDFVDLVEVEADCTAKVKAEVLEKNEGYEDYPPCVQLSSYAPLLTVKLDVLGDLGQALDCEWNIISEDNAPLKSNTHLERNRNNELKPPIEGTEEVCTHVRLYPSDYNIFGTGFKAAIVGGKSALKAAENRVKEEAERRIQEKADEIAESIESAIEQALDDFFSSLCSSCNCRY